MKVNVPFITKVFLAVLNSALAIVSIIWTLVQISEKAKIAPFTPIAITFVSIILATIMIGLINLQKVNTITSKNKNQSEYIHGVLHRLKNYTCKLDATYDNKQYTDNECLSNSITDMCDLMDYLSQALTEITGSAVRACIKATDKTYTQDNIFDAGVYTFARSGKPNVNDILHEQNEQENAGVHIIKNNTDFLELVATDISGRRKTYFYQENLKAYDEKLRLEGKEYKNSTPNWESKYITTIVCPIRYKQQEFELLGFLCVDSLDANAFKGEKFFLCASLLRGLADSLYVYFNELYFYKKQPQEAV